MYYHWYYQDNDICIYWDYHFIILSQSSSLYAVEPFHTWWVTFGRSSGLLVSCIHHFMDNKSASDGCNVGSPLLQLIPHSPLNKIIYLPTSYSNRIIVLYIHTCLCVWWAIYCIAVIRTLQVKFFVKKRNLPPEKICYLKICEWVLRSNHMILIFCSQFMCQLLNCVVHHTSYISS